MAATTPDNHTEPLPAEPFTLEELFFSTTDARGFIRSSNDVFVRVSRYGVDELEGQPHNKVRHPDMPRVVFRELWGHLNSGQGIGAYVLNRAKDGSPYWVFAVARPVGDGHLSVRLKPTTPLFPLVVSLYQELRAVEASIEDGSHHHGEAMEASAAILGTRLQAAGFDDYDSFMRVATVAEVTARRTAVRQTGSATTTAGMGLAAFLDGQLGSVESYLGLNQQLTARSGSLVTLTTEASLLGFNVTVAASRLGADGRPLRVLAGIMQETGVELVGCARSLAHCLDSTRSLLEEVGFSIAVASLQNDMSAVMAGEVGAISGHAQADVELMATCLRSDLEAVVAATRAIDANLADAIDLGRQLERSLRVLDTVILSGQVEVTRTTGAEFFAALFERAQALVVSGLDDARAIVSAVSDFTRSRPAIDHSAAVRHLDPVFTA